MDVDGLNRILLSRIVVGILLFIILRAVLEVTLEGKIIRTWCGSYVEWWRWPRVSPGWIRLFWRKLWVR